MALTRDDSTHRNTTASFKNDDHDKFFFQIDSAINQGKIRFFFNDEKNGSSSFNFDDSMQKLKDRLYKMQEDLDMDVFFFDNSSEAQKELIERLRDLTSNFDSFNDETKNTIIIRKKVLIKDLEDSDNDLKKIGDKKAKPLDLGS